MKRLLLFSFLTISLWISGYSQTISDVLFYLTEDQYIVVEYNISEAQSSQYFNVSLWVSRDGGTTFTGPLKRVTGDVGKRIRRGNGKKIHWDANKEMPGFGGEIVFDVRADVNQKQKDTSQKENSITRKQVNETSKQTKATTKQTNTTQNKKKNQFFLGYKGSYLAPFGVVMGVTGKPGFYLSARTDYGFFLNAEYTTNGETIEPYNSGGYLEFSGSSETQRLFATAGMLFELNPNTNIYFGAGYTRYNLLWHVYEYDYPSQYIGSGWANYTEESYNGIELEGGFMFHLRSIFLSAGVNAHIYGFNADNVKLGLDGTLGVGVIF